MKLNNIKINPKPNTAEFDITYTNGSGLWNSLRSVLQIHIPIWSFSNVSINKNNTIYKPEQLIHKLKTVHINQELKNFNYGNFKFSADLKNDTNNLKIITIDDIVDNSKHLFTKDIYFISLEPGWRITISGKMKNSTKFIENNGFHNSISNISQKEIIPGKKYHITCQLLECYKFKRLLNYGVDELIKLFEYYKKKIIPLDDDAHGGKKYITDDNKIDNIIFEPIKNILSKRIKWCGYYWVHIRENIYTLILIDDKHDETQKLKNTIDEIIKTLKNIKKNIN